MQTYSLGNSLFIPMINSMAIIELGRENELRNMPVLRVTGSAKTTGRPGVTMRPEGVSATVNIGLRRRKP